VTKYLLDTNHASRLMGKDNRIVGKVRQAIQTGDEFGISMTILGELYFAVYASQRQMQNLQRLSRLLATLHIYAFDSESAEAFGKIQAEQKAKGRPIPPLDAQISAVARQQGLTVLTADRHFDYIVDLDVENWLAE
jgi:predicted nucleic acid-binding protein